VKLGMNRRTVVVEFENLAKALAAYEARIPGSAARSARIR
jgi:hypothetical protein